VFFDLDNTLIERAPLIEGYLDDLSRRYPGTLASADAQRWLRDLDDAGRGDRASFCAAVANRFPELWPSPDQVWQDFAQGFVEAVCPQPEVARLLRGLARRYRLVLVSNGDPLRQRRKLERAGLTACFAAEDVFISEEVGVAKPDRRLFDHALRHTDQRADRVLFVGDDPVRDIAGAQALGMPTCWVSHGRAYPEGVVAPTFAVERVEQLESAIRSF